MPITAMNHFTVLTENLEKTLRFYVGVLGLLEGPRPALGFPGAWLYVGDQAVLHVVVRPVLPEPGRGVLDHMAFSATGLDEVVARLTAAGYRYDLRRQPDTALWQLFVVDPNGARVELNFAPDESPRVESGELTRAGA